MGLQETLAAIDEVAVHQCGYCSRPLAADGWSLDFCNQWCQQYWTENHAEVVRLIGYSEPYDLPQHASNLVELDSLETTPVDPDDDDWHMSYGGDLVFDLHLDTSHFDAAMRRAQVGLRRLVASWSPARGSAIQLLHEDRQRARADDEVFFTGLTPDFVIFDEIRDWQLVDDFGQSLVSLAPQPQHDVASVPFGSDFDFEHRAATSLPDEPPAAVMPDLPARDWQAIVDARVSHTGPQRVVRAPRHLGRTR